MPIENPEAQLRLGTVDSQFVTMQFSIVIDANGCGRLRIFMMEKQGRRGGQLIELGADGLRDLREMVDHVQTTIDRMKTSGQIQKSGDRRGRMGGGGTR